MVTLISITPDSEKVIEQMGRVCYQSKNVNNSQETTKKFLNSIIKNGHHSVLEHASASFVIDNVSRSLTHQLVRSRIVSFSQKSQRYCKEEKFNFITPEPIKNKKEAVKIYNEIMMHIQEAYNNLVYMGINKEDARYVLPNACDTEIGMTMNFREILHTIDLRVSRHAQWEIRNLFIEIWKQLHNCSPNIFNTSYFEYCSKDLEYKKEIFELQILH